MALNVVSKQAMIVVSSDYDCGSLHVTVGIGEGELYVLLAPVSMLDEISELPPLRNSNTPAAPPPKTHIVNAVRITIRGALDFFTPD